MQKTSIKLRDIQEEILNFLTNRQSSGQVFSNEVLDELKIYKELISNSAESTIEDFFYFTSQIIQLQGKDLYAFVQEYLEAYPSKSPIYLDFCDNFPIFIQEKFTEFPNYLSDLALFELKQIKVLNSLDKNPYLIFETQYPILQIMQIIKNQIDELKDLDIEEEQETILIYRDSDFLVKILAISNTSKEIIEMFENGLSQDQIFDKIKAKNASIKQEDFDELILNLKNRNILLN